MTSNNGLYTSCEFHNADSHIYADLGSEVKVFKCVSFNKSTIRMSVCVLAVFVVAVVAVGSTYAIIHFLNNNQNDPNMHMSYRNESKCKQDLCRSEETCYINQKGNPVCLHLNTKTQDDRKATKTQDISTPFRIMMMPNKCPDGWFTHGMACYISSIERKTWFQARDYCRSMGSDLVSLHSIVQTNALVQFFSTKNVYWIGLHDVDKDGNFQWTDETALDFTYWFPDEPNRWNQFEDCVVMKKGDGKWNDANCYLPKHFICELEINANCGRGDWLFFNGSCYSFNPSSGTSPILSWDGARQYCKNQNADLVVINSMTEHSFITSQADRAEPIENLSSDKWIGLRSPLGTNEYKWIDGSGSKFFLWKGGYPKYNINKRNCVLLESILGNIFDVGCDLKSGFICEKRL